MIQLVFVVRESMIQLVFCCKLDVPRRDQVGLCDSKLNEHESVGVTWFVVS